MKVQYLKSASVIVECGGIRVLCDPWLTDGIYYGSWYHYPPLPFGPSDFADVDYIYISHIHPDHCDVATLKQLPKTIPVIILDFEEKFLFKLLTGLGFRVIEMGNREVFWITDDFEIQLLAADDCRREVFTGIMGCQPPGEYIRTRQIDSLAIFRGENQVVMNFNDVPIHMIRNALPYLRERYGKPDLILVGYAGAGPFPQVYDLKPEEKIDKAIKAGLSFLSQTWEYVKKLEPIAYMPFAGQYTLGGRLAWANKYKGTLELEEMPEEFHAVIRKQPDITADPVMVDLGGTYDVGTRMTDKPFKPIDFEARKRYVADVLAAKPFAFDAVIPEPALPLLQAARERLWAKQEQYGYFSPWSVILDFAPESIYIIRFDAKEVKVLNRGNIEIPCPAVTARLDARLMDQILKRKAHWNNAEVGSHITLQTYVQASNGYRDYEPMVHFLMSYFQV